MDNDTARILMRQLLRMAQRIAAQQDEELTEQEQRHLAKATEQMILLEASLMARGLIP